MTRKEAIEVIKAMGTDLQISFFSQQGKALLLAIRSLEAWDDVVQEICRKIENYDAPCSFDEAVKKELSEVNWFVFHKLKEVEE